MQKLSSRSLLSNPTVQTVLVIAIVLVLAGIGFMISVQTQLWEAAQTIADILALIALVYAFKQLK